MGRPVGFFFGAASHNFLFGFSWGQSLTSDLRMTAIKIANAPCSWGVLEFDLPGEALGYARQSPRQVLALMRAARDPDEGVRNNATRAIAVLARANHRLASQISPDTFIEMLNSGIWTDRNKGAMVLMSLTAKRDPAVLTNQLYQLRRRNRLTGTLDA